MMRTFDCPRCPLCSTAGEFRYTALKDRLFSAPGEWNFRKCANSACGILWLDPMPMEDDLGDAYLDYLTHDYTAHFEPNRAQLAYLHRAYGYPKPAGAASLRDAAKIALSYLHLRRRADFDGHVFHLPFVSSGRLLDVGCGNGNGMTLMAALGWRVEGVEVDPVAIETAAARGLTVHSGTLADQHFPDDTFDAVTLSHVIEHVPSPVELISECRRVLKPGGFLVMLTPNAAGLGHRLYGANWAALEPPRHLHVFTRTALEAATRQAAFTDVEVTSATHGAAWIVLASQEIRRTGRGDVLANSRISRRWAKLCQIIEMSALLMNGGLGEEIVVRARKDA